jgi:DNA polymerase-3 subunit epsilon
METKIREIILDTETTGLYARGGDRIIEIGCIELINRVRTGRHFHRFINPKRDIPADATRIHGITNEHVKDKPTFDEVIKEFIDFIHIDSSLVIHNAGFDMSFLNMEFELCKAQLIEPTRVIDTLNMARRKFPGSPASLDALCKRFKISLELREKHGALIDAELLASVYLNLLGGGSQTAMNLFEAETANVNSSLKTSQNRPLRTFQLSDEEIAQHEELLKKINSPIWKAGA